MEHPRRTFIRAGVALTATAWVTPSVITIDRIQAASPSVPCEVPSVSGGAVLISAPPTLQEGTPSLDSNTTSWVFPEQGPIQLPSDLVVNRTVAGAFDGSSNENAVIPAGSWVCSYYVHGDRLDDNGQLTGQLQFSSANIIGLIYRQTEIDASNYLQAPATTYFTSFLEAADTMTLDLTPGSNRVTWTMNFGAALDSIRVIVNCP